MNSNYLHSDITGKILKAFYNVYNKLGFGFLEKVYEKSMLIELRKLGLKAENQKQIKVYYNNAEVGLLLNFGKIPQKIRRVLTKEYK